ncbi:MAG: hypothetical protein E3J86_03285, partial [Candidatus Thorarchaeota archaeon]
MREDKMLPDEIIKAVADTISGIRAKDYASSISAFHRIQGSPGFQEAIEYVKSAVQSVSDAKVEVFEYPTDGKISI